MTCDELARVWPERFPRPDAETTKQNGRMVRKFARDFKGRDPRTVDVVEARSWALANLGSVRFVRSMFNDFQAEGAVDKNVWAGMKLPMPGSKPVVVPTEEQVFTLIEFAQISERFDLASRIEFAAFVGIRYAEQKAFLVPGETILGNALDNFAPARIRRGAVDWQLGRDGKLKTPKTPRSLRVVMIPQQGRKAVHEARSHRRGESAFLWPAGRRQDSEAWGALRREARIWFKWHDLRHFCATWLLNKGATVDDVAVQLGCRRDQVVDTYGHPDRELALGRLEDLVNG